MHERFVSSEQYAVCDFIKASKEGQDIDGEVLNYLELAQVCSTFCIKTSQCKTFIVKVISSALVSFSPTLNKNKSFGQTLLLNVRHALYCSY